MLIVAGQLAKCRINCNALRHPFNALPFDAGRRKRRTLSNAAPLSVGGRSEEQGAETSTRRGQGWLATAVLATAVLSQATLLSQNSDLHPDFMRARLL